jgi:hypothetical protein
MKKLLIGFTLLASMSSFAQQGHGKYYDTKGEYTVDEQTKESYVDKVTKTNGKENHYEILLAQRAEVGVLNYVPVVGYYMTISDLESNAEDDGIVDILDMYCSKNVSEDAQANSIDTSVGYGAVQQSGSTLSTFIKYHFSCD